ncbi:sensor histidine kinase [Bailinhaonella thermotolerans]|uniref:Signal transduction histidine-protein kinase/phosphatase MprB n=1 Tax=Bailinhaonella thermotolerans TaxID=1070861 RepID=A0A3A4AYW8_9ACTN|nr:ATP-binding protein [Bailinhaonella thermotolerans]RJL33579.1 sensor histidine kinase [Bailinhaonella thermotolerans]
MRSRLLFSTLSVAVVAVLLLGIPLAVVMSRLVTDETRDSLEREAVRLLNEVENSDPLDRPIDRDQIARNNPGRYIEIDLVPGNQRITIGTPPPADSAMRSQVRSESGTRVLIMMDAREVTEQSTDALVIIGVVGSMAIAVAVGLAIVQSRRLTLPLQDLADIADRLGSGDARPSKHRYGIRELDRVAEVLDRSAVRISDLLAAEREFATDASHQLRTPLTGLTIRLEEIVASADEPDVVREEGAAAIVQAERLTAVIDELLSAARRQRHSHAEPTDIDHVIEQQVKEWTPTFKHAKRRIQVQGQKGLHALATPGGLAQVIATLLENALTHGDGTVTITTAERGGSVVIEVGDEGPGVPQDLATRIFERNVTGGKGTGLGLTLARGLAAADGGRLELVRPKPAAFAIFLRPVEESRTRVVAGPA